MTEPDPTSPLRIFIGFDPRQIVSYTALTTSLVITSSRPIATIPLVLDTVPITRAGLTPFTYSRFLVPWLCGFEGWALFLDADELVLGDIAELFAMADETRAVMVADDPVYSFEWASVMLFNCAHPDNRVLTPDYIDDAARCRDPHGIDWTDNRGSLPPEWNVLVGYQEIPENPKLLHYSCGVPAFPETQQTPTREFWERMVHVATSAHPWAELMGQSIHAKTLADGRVVPVFFDENHALAVE